MASLAASDASPVAVPALDGSQEAVARAHAALPARSATNVRIAGLAVLCAATLVAPALLLVWMPIVLGVPHLANDVRFLVLPLPRRQRVLAIAACGGLVALKAAALIGGAHVAAYEAIVVAAWLVGMWAIGPAPPSRRSHALARHRRVCEPGPESRRSEPQANLRGGGRTAGLLAVGAAAVAIVLLPIQFAIVAAFAHNFVALVAWVVVRKPERAHVGTVLITIAAALVALVVLGPGLAATTGGDANRWLTVDGAAAAMFGGVPITTARGLMIGFAFLQAVHYAIWLDWIPRGTSSMSIATSGLRRRASTAGARARFAMALVIVGTLVVVGAACVDAAWARTTYLALATFHIYLELVVLGVRGAARLGAARRLA